MKAPFRTKFDPAQDFAARRRITVGGRTFYPGEDFDKSLVAERRLKLLFDQRSLVYRKDDSAPGANLTPEETAQTRRGQHAARASANVQRRAAAPKAPPKAKRAVKPDPRLTHLQRRQAAKTAETFSDPRAIAKARRKVKIPADWATMAWPQRLRLAAQLTDEKVRNGPDAERAIKGELKRRGQHP